MGSSGTGVGYMFISNIFIQLGRVLVLALVLTGCASSTKVSAGLAVIVPREQFINPVDLVVGTAAEDVGEPRLRIDII
jgi:hypothetical protein